MTSILERATISDDPNQDEGVTQADLTAMSDQDHFSVKDALDIVALLEQSSPTTEVAEPPNSDLKTGRIYKVENLPRAIPTFGRAALKGIDTSELYQTVHQMPTNYRRMLGATSTQRLVQRYSPIRLY